ncbi:MAG: hypothetical protein J6S85_17685 [Methanobrevibacter sp.]|nr:hypothetical protein [Methanobrevibacter sp.]
MKLWVDDVRKPPSNEYAWAKTVDGAKSMIEVFREKGEQIVIDLDHDAGDYVNQGGDYIKILDWMEEQGINDIAIHLHTMNVVGRENMRRIIQHNGWKQIY